MGQAGIWRRLRDPHSSGRRGSVGVLRRVVTHWERKSFDSDATPQTLTKPLDALLHIGWPLLRWSRYEDFRRPDGLGSIAQLREVLGLETRSIRLDLCDYQSSVDHCDHI